MKSARHHCRSQYRSPLSGFRTWYAVHRLVRARQRCSPSDCKTPCRRFRRVSVWSACPAADYCRGNCAPQLSILRRTIQFRKFRAVLAPVILGVFSPHSSVAWRTIAVHYHPRGPKESGGRRRIQLSRPDNNAPSKTSPQTTSRTCRHRVIAIPNVRFCGRLRDPAAESQRKTARLRNGNARIVPYLRQP